MKLPRPKVFLSTLLLLTLTIASGGLLWTHQAPWYKEVTWSIPAGKDPDLFDAHAPDGSYFILWAHNGYLMRAVDSLTGVEFARYTSPEKLNSVFSIRPTNNRTVFICDPRKIIQTWNLKTGTISEATKLRDREYWLESVSGKFMVRVPEEKAHSFTARNMDSGHDFSFAIPNANNWIPRLSPSGQFIMIHRIDGICELWDAANKRLHGNYRLDGGDDFNLVFSPDERFFLTLDYQHRLKLHSLAKPELPGRMLTDSSAGPLQFTADYHIVSADDSGEEIMVRDLENPQPLFRMQVTSKGVFDEIIEIPTLGRFITSEKGSSTVVRSWDSKTGAPLCTLSEGYPIWQFHWVKDRLVIRFSDHSIEVWGNRRPEYWWGVAYLPEFWITLIFSILLLLNLYRNLKHTRSAT